MCLGPGSALGIGSGSGFGSEWKLGGADEVNWLEVRAFCNTLMYLGSGSAFGSGSALAVGSGSGRDSGASCGKLVASCRRPEFNDRYLDSGPASGSGSTWAGALFLFERDEELGLVVPALEGAETYLGSGSGLGSDSGPIRPTDATSEVDSGGEVE